MTDTHGQRLPNSTLLRHDRLAEDYAALCPTHAPLVRKRVSVVDSMRNLPPRIKKRFGSGTYVDSEECARRATRGQVVLDSEAQALVESLYKADFALLASMTP